MVGHCRARFFTRWIEKSESKNPNLLDISNGEYEHTTRQYRELLQLKREVSAKYLKRLLKKQMQQFESLEKQRKAILNETKKKRLLPIRKLLENYPDLINVVSIWMVSPETASTLFPLEEGYFDLVIFDEASQCPLENSIPAVYRAKKLVICGDDKQLKPNMVGKKVGLSYEEEDEEYVEELEESESLLSLAARAFQSKRLKWHYRSASEELINFSNHAFYKDIQVAPNVKPFSDLPAIQWIETDGVWMNNQNLKEAEKVVELIRNHLINGDGKSLGVVTFNQEQAQLIERLLETKIQEDPEFRQHYEMIQSGPLDSRITIKNIENIQGDERDIMIFSIAYGRNIDGNVVHQFGSLSQAGGENRLNVAITRAKHRIIIVCSIYPSELTVNEQNLGPYYFKKYLEYAYFVSKKEHANALSILKLMNNKMKIAHRQQELKFNSIFEREVYEALTKMGYTVHTQVGASNYRIDLAIINPDCPTEYILGVECDGAMYHSSKSARERDVTRQLFLERQGWKIERIWSRNWWKHPKREIDRIVKRVELLRKEEESKPHHIITEKKGLT
jgi:superfamily I DNA and/or RNA helicase/very-short-patch-repair endonuclease